MKARLLSRHSYTCMATLAAVLLLLASISDPLFAEDEPPSQPSVRRFDNSADRPVFTHPRVIEFFEAYATEHLQVNPDDQAGWHPYIWVGVKAGRHKPFAEVHYFLLAQGLVDIDHIEGSARPQLILHAPTVDVKYRINFRPEETGFVVESIRKTRSVGNFGYSWLYYEDGSDPVYFGETSTSADFSAVASAVMSDPVTHTFLEEYATTNLEAAATDLSRYSWKDGRQRVMPLIIYFASRGLYFENGLLTARNPTISFWHSDRNGALQSMKVNIQYGAIDGDPNLGLEITEITIVRRTLQSDDGSDNGKYERKFLYKKGQS